MNLFKRKKPIVRKVKTDFGYKLSVGGTRIRVEDVVLAYYNDDAHDAEWIAENFGIPIAHVFAALQFYHENEALVDNRLWAEETWARMQQEK